METLPGLKGKFSTILADPPWRFTNRTGKVAPEHVRLRRYETMSIDEICAMPVAAHAENPAHLYLWVPNALLPWCLRVMDAWGFSYNDKGIGRLIMIVCRVSRRPFGIAVAKEKRQLRENRICSRFACHAAR